MKAFRFSSGGGIAKNITRVFSIVIASAALALLLPASVKAEFQVAFTGAVEKRPAVAYNSLTDKFLVAYAIEYSDGFSTYYHVQTQLHNACISSIQMRHTPFFDEIVNRSHLIE